MPTLGPDRTIRARKEHRCDLCGLRIRKGATYVYREGVEGREHWRMRMHAVCKGATQVWGIDEWEYDCDPADFRHYELDLQPQTVPNIVAEILRGGK